MQFGDYREQSTTCFVTAGNFFPLVLRLIYFLQREDSLLFCFKNSWPNTFASGSEYKVAVVVAFFIHTVTTDNFGDMFSKHGMNIFKHSRKGKIDLF